MKWINIPPETITTIQDLIINLNKKLRMAFNSIESSSNKSVNATDFTVNESISAGATVEKEITIGNGYTNGNLILKVASNYGYNILFNTIENGCILQNGNTINAYQVEGYLFPGSAGSTLGAYIQLNSIYISGDKIKIKLSNTDTSAHTCVIVACVWQVFK